MRFNLPNLVLLTFTAFASLSACTGGESSNDGGAADSGFDGGPCWSLKAGEICAGAAAVTLTPDFYEIVKPELLETKDNCIGGGATCGAIDQDKVKAACGRDWKDKFFIDKNGNGLFDGFWLAGFAFSRPMQDIHDDLWARAAAFKNGPSTAVIVSLDVIGYFFSDLNNIRKTIAKNHPEFGQVDIVLSSTHTHSAVDTLGIWSMEDPYTRFYVQDPKYLGMVNNEYVDWVNGRIVSAIEQAVSGLKPARLKVASKRIGVEGIVNDIRDPYIIDDTLSILSAVDVSGTSIATIVNFSNHCESLWDSHNILSSDYSHYLREALEKGLPAAGSKPMVPGLGGVAIYVQADEGGMITPEGADVHDRAGNPQPNPGFERTRAVGEALAEKTFELLKEAADVQDTSMKFLTYHFKPPVNNFDFYVAFQMDLLRKRELFTLDPSKGYDFGNIAVETEIAQLRIGPVTFQTAPGELFPELVVGGYFDPYPYSYGHQIITNTENPPNLSKAPQGPYLRDLIPGQYKFLCGLGQDQLGYIVPVYDYKAGEPGQHYEESRSLGDHMAGMVQEGYQKLLGK